MRLSAFVHGVPLLLSVIGLQFLFGSQAEKKERQLLQTITVTVLLGVIGILSLRSRGIQGNYLPDPTWRWRPTAEAVLLASRNASNVIRTADWAPSSLEWPGFRGPERNGCVSESGRPFDWTKSPPTIQWDIPIGPAWSSFAYASGRLFTQEQRGPKELVTCYDSKTGELIWRHEVEARFADTLSGAGPRATPSIDHDHVYAMGGKGTLSCLDIASGDAIWTRDLAAEFGAKTPEFGHSCSPLLAGANVIVYTDGGIKNGLSAFDLITGRRNWSVSIHGENYSSPQLLTLNSVEQVLFSSEDGLYSIDGATGAVLWKFAPRKWDGPPMCQPQALSEDSIIVPTGDGTGIVRLEIKRDGQVWKINEQWQSRSLKASFNDFVVCNDAIFGFDKNIFTVVDSSTGSRIAKIGRFGYGQALSLKNRQQVLVVSENGDLVMLSMREGETETVRLPALDGKTWNHPIWADGVLYLRNSSRAIAVIP